MIPISEAISIINREIVTLETETIDLTDSIGRVLAQTVKADMDLPPFDRSQMDGFAVRLKDIEKASEENPIKLKVIGESVAGKGFDGKLKKGETVRIMTGARVPNGADSVQKKELTQETENGFVEIFEPTKKQQNIVLQASEIKNREKVSSKGEIINEKMITVLASFGYAKIKVYKQPIITVLATGSEIVEISQTPQKDQIRDSNSITIRVLCEQVGANVETLPLMHDDFDSLKSVIAESCGLNQNSKTKDQRPNILILSGGVSVGDYDFTKPALYKLGAKIFFEKVALRPGKPTVFAKLNDCYIFGLPGNPVSVAVTFHLFVRQAILQMQNARDFGLKEGFAVLTKKMKGAKERDSYLPAKMSFEKDAKISITPINWGGSSDFVSFANADCLIFVPQDKIIERGEIAKIVFI